MELYLTGQAVSSGLSVILTGAILRHLPHDLTVPVPGFAPLVLHPWRVAFIAAGLLGLLVVPFMLAVREPPRQETARTSRLSIAEGLRILLRRRRQLGPLVLGLAAFAADFYATLAWSAVSITRHYGLRIVEVAGLLGPASIAAGLLGPCAAGLLVDRIMTRTGAPDLAQRHAASDARQHQNLRGVNRAGGEDRFAFDDRLVSLNAHPIAHRHASSRDDLEAEHRGAGAHRQVAPAEHRPQVGPVGRHPVAAVKC